MSVPTMDFDWLLDHATAIAFDPGRPGIYVFALGMTAEQLQERVLAPMGEANLFSVTETKFIDDRMRANYRGQLPRIGLTRFDVMGQPCGIVLTYHPKFQPELSQYREWLEFWHAGLLEAARATA